MKVFDDKNLVAWSIVRFDTLKRTPAARAEMLQRVGLTQFAYDWNTEHIPTFDDELAQLEARGIRLRAFYNRGGWPESPAAVANSKNMVAALDFLKRHDLKIDVWAAYKGEGAEGLVNREEQYAAAANRIGILADVVNAIGCRLSIYNHGGGWYGEPEFLLEIATRLSGKNVGIVYNFFHGHDHLDRMPQAFNAMLPYLSSIGINGITPGGPKFLPLGKGTEDRKILEMVSQSGYAGPVEILGHVGENTDVEIALANNLAGLHKLVQSA